MIILIHADFVFDGVSCDEYGVFIAQFDNADIGKMGISQKTSLITEQSRKNDIFHIISQKYDEPLTFEMHIFCRDFSNITQEHERILKKWLMQRGKYKWFTILDKRYSGIWFKANIHSPENIRVNNVVAISFQVTCDAAYAYSDLIEEEFKLTNSNRTASIYVDNDDDSPIYPDMEITMLSNGNLEIKNDIDKNKNIFKINDLKTGEIITIKGDLPSIESSKDTINSNIYNRFSKYWLWLADGDNNITVSNNCILKLSYREKRRMGIQ